LEKKMRKMFLGSLAAIAGAMFATAGMADGVGVDVQQLDVSIQVMPDGAGLMALADVLPMAAGGIYVLSDGADLLVIADAVLVAAVMQPMEAPGGAFTLLVNDPDAIVWSSGVTAFAVPPDLLI
jgi:hypothetical protein